MPVEFTVVSYLARRGLGKQGEASPGKELGDSARMVKPIGIAHQGRRDVHSESGARERGAKVKDRPTVRGWKGRKRIAFVPSVKLFFSICGSRPLRATPSSHAWGQVCGGQNRHVETEEGRGHLSTNAIAVVKTPTSKHRLLCESWLGCWAGAGVCRSLIAGCAGAATGNRFCGAGGAGGAGY